MKKLYFILVLLMVASCVFAQSTSPRFGTTPNSDNTGRVLNYKLVTVVDVAGADSIIAKTDAWTTIYKITLLDSLTLKQPVVTLCKYGDNIEIIATCVTGTPKLKFTGSKWMSAGTAILSTNKKAVIKFVFDGVEWIETGRYVQ